MCWYDPQKNFSNLKSHYSALFLSTPAALPVCISPACAWRCACGSAPAASPAGSCDRARTSWLLDPPRSVSGSSDPACPPPSQRLTSAAGCSELWPQNTHRLTCRNVRLSNNTISGCLESAGIHITHQSLIQLLTHNCTMTQSEGLYVLMYSVYFYFRTLSWWKLWDVVESSCKSSDLELIWFCQTCFILFQHFHYKYKMESNMETFTVFYRLHLAHLKTSLHHLHFFYSFGFFIGSSFWFVVIL